jgi:hypothetical protein
MEIRSIFKKNQTINALIDSLQKENNEEFRVIPIGIFNHYLISESGKVFNSKRGRFISSASHKYLKYHLCTLVAADRSYRKIIYNHELVLITFVLKTFKERYKYLTRRTLTADHIDNDRTNNHYTNLQLLTCSQNLKKTYKGYREKSTQRELIDNKKLAKEMFKKGIPIDEICKTLKRSTSSVTKYILY